MKNIVLILIFVLLLVGGIIWYLKPNQSAHALQQDAPLEKINQQQALDHSAMQNAETQSLYNGSVSEPTSQKSKAELVDTKSDPSIQPIDPEKDPANQVLDSK